ncbi:hypothetical protein D3C85_1202850 [compost metagenome]
MVLVRRRIPGPAPQVVGALPGQLEAEVDIGRQAEETGAALGRLYVLGPRLHPRRDGGGDSLANLHRLGRRGLQRFQGARIVTPRQQNRQITRPVRQQQLLVAQRQAVRLTRRTHQTAVPA